GACCSASFCCRKRFGKNCREFLRCHSERSKAESRNPAALPNGDSTSSLDFARDNSSHIMSFGAPEWFWALLVVPALVGLYLRAEHNSARRLREFVSPRLLPHLAATLNRPRRVLRFSLQLLGLALAIVSLAQPRWGYTFQDVKRKGLDLLLAVDTSRSMLSNAVSP